MTYKDTGLQFTSKQSLELVGMERAFFRNVVRGVIITQIFLTSTCVGASPCSPKSDPLGRYTISGGSSNIWSHGTPSGSAVHVSLRCNPGSTAQPSVTSQCRDGTWDPSWPHCVVASPCRPKSDPLGRYTISGGSSNIWSQGTPSGSAVHVSLRCDPGSTAQPSVTSQCRDGTWDPSWPHCEKPCSVPRNRGEVRQFVNGSSTRPVTQYSTSLLPDGTELVARCRDPGKHRLVGDLRRTCQGGQWIGDEPQCQPVETQVLFRGAEREVASNGTVVVHVYRTQPRGNPKHLYVVCRITRFALRPPRLTTPLVNDRELQRWHYLYSHWKRLDPIRTEYSGVYTCSGSSSSHSVQVVFKAAECEAPGEPEHGRYIEQPPHIIQHGTTVSFQCDEDYRLVGSRSITCHKGEWAQDPPVCKVYRCPELTIPDNAIMEGVYGYGRRINSDERIFRCRNGYVLRGETNNLRCLEGGVWSAPLPTCEAVVHHVSPCEGVRCASWERCVVTGPNTWVCGCINPSSCLTSGPTVCGTNGRYYSSECHLKAFACLMDLELDVAENDHWCIYGVPEKERRPTQQATVDEIPQHLSSSSSFEEYEGVPGVDNPPSDAPVAEETDPLDYLSFESLDSSISSFDILIEETSHSTPTPSTPTQSTPRAFTSESGEGGAETTPLTPVNSTLARSTPKVLSPDDVGAVTTPSIPVNSTLARSPPKVLRPDDVGAVTPPPTPVNSTLPRSTPKVLRPDDVGAETTQSTPVNSTLSRSTPKVLGSDDVGAETTQSTPVNSTLSRSTPKVFSPDDVGAETTQLTTVNPTLARSTPKTFNSAEGVNGTLELNPVNSTRSRPFSSGPSSE